MNALASSLIRPESEEFVGRCSGWNTRIAHRPDYVVAARTPADVQEAVRFAAERSLPIRVQATGHGALDAYDGGVLIDTSGIGGVEIDSSQQCAVLGAGVRWQALLDTAQAHGLAGLAGSSPAVGVVGYALGGGAGWLARGYGLCSDMIEAAEVTTADAVQRWVSADSDPDLLWALRGGGGNFSVVTALRLRLVPLSVVHAGAIYWPMAQAREVLTAYREWLAEVPSDLGSAIAFLQYPAGAPVPEPVRGKPVVALRVCFPGGQEQAEKVLAPMRRIAGIVLDTTRSMPFSEIGSVTMDSPLHLPRIGYSESICELTDQIIAALPEVLIPGAPFIAMEMRHAAEGAARPSVGHEGMGYWDSPFLFFGMSITPDAETELAAANLGERLDAILKPSRTGTNVLTFLLHRHTPEGRGEVERVKRTYRPAHYARLAELKKQYDPDNLLGGDRNIPPA